MYKFPKASKTICSSCRKATKKNEVVVFTQDPDGHRFHRECLTLMGRLVNKVFKPGEIVRFAEVQEHRDKLAAGK